MDPDKDKSLEEKLDMIQQRFKKFKTRAAIPADDAKWLMKAVKPLFERTRSETSIQPDRALEQIISNLLDKQEYQKAALLFRKQWTSQIAEALLKRGKRQEALDFSSHLDHANRENLLRSMAMWYANQHDLAQALEIAEIIQDPETHAYAESNIAHILSLQKQFQKAKEIALSIQDRGYREDAILDIVKAYLQNRQVDEAIKFVDSFENSYEKSKPAKVIAADLKTHHQNEKVREVRKIFSLFPIPIRMAA